MGDVRGDLGRIATLGRDDGDLRDSGPEAGVGTVDAGIVERVTPASAAAAAHAWIVPAGEVENERSRSSKAASGTRTRENAPRAAPPMWEPSETSPTATFQDRALSESMLSESVTKARRSPARPSSALVMAAPWTVSAPTTRTGMGRRIGGGVGPKPGTHSSGVVL